MIPGPGLADHPCNNTFGRVDNFAGGTSASQTRGMAGGLGWSIVATGVVNATPEAVMSWWFHPDREGDFQDRLGLTNVTEFEVSESTDDGGVQVRLTSWRDQRGWSQRHRIERHLTAGRLGQAVDGIFTVPCMEVISYEHPTGKTMALQCSGRIDFIPKSGGSTEVVVAHKHHLTGGRWLWRRNLRKSDERNQPDLLQRQIGLCEVALGATT